MQRMSQLQDKKDSYHIWILNQLHYGVWGIGRKGTWIPDKELEDWMPVNAFKGAYYFKTELVKKKT